MLLKIDFDTHMYDEIITAINRGDDVILEKAIKAAEQQAKGYLSHWDIDTLFDAELDDRDDMLLMYLKDLAVWHFIVKANPNINVEFFKERFDDAITEFGKIQKGIVVPHGWPPAVTPEGGDSSFHITSAQRRETRF